MNTEKFEIIAKTFQGLEDVLAQEIITLGGEEVEQGKRMVSFIGDKEMLYKANLHLRTALRILKPIYTFQASNTDEVYEFLKKITWEKHIDPTQTFSIDSVVFSDNFRHSKFVTYRAKDAIADYFQEKFDRRPSVRITNADLSLNLHISGLTCTLSLDSSGESLHKRGYRVDQNDAPLNEVLAAGMILKSGWKGDKNFFDPMCGSGTLLVEAAMIATNTPPGIYRKGFAFEKWNDYDEDLFDKLYNDDSGEREFEFKVIGSDISPRAVEIAKENIKSAGFSRFVYLKTMPFQNYTPETAPKDCTMIMNPPYGERISSRDILSLYELIGTTLKHQFKGTEAWILSYREECFEKIGLKPSLKYDLMNGGLDCEFRKYEIFEGRLKSFKEAGGEFDKTREAADLEITDNRMKRELRKERFTGERISARQGAFNKQRGDSRPARRESTFKKEGEFKRREEGDFKREGGFNREGGFRKREGGDFNREGGFRKREGGDFKREGGFHKREGGDFNREGGFRKREGGDFNREGGFRKREGGDFNREGGFRKREGGDFKREGGFRKREGGDFNREGGFRKREGGDFNREGGFRKREGGDFNREGGFRKREEGDFNRERRSFKESGNFRRNAEGKLELRTDGEYKPRGERTFNPNRPMFIPNNDKKDQSSED